MTARATSPEAMMRNTVAGRLRALGTRGVLVQVAERGQIIELLLRDAEVLLPQGPGLLRPWQWGSDPGRVQQSPRV